MRTLVFLFITSFVITLIAVAYLLGQKSVNVNLASLTTRPVACFDAVKPIETKMLENQQSTLFPLIKHNIAANSDNTNNSGATPKEAIDTTVIHAIRQGKWSEEDNRVFLTYISHLDKKERISVLKQLNNAINYQQMHIVGSYIPNL